MVPGCVAEAVGEPRRASRVENRPIREADYRSGDDHDALGNWDLPGKSSEPPLAHHNLPPQGNGLAKRMAKPLRTRLWQAQGTLEDKHWDDPETKLKYSNNSSIQETIERPHFFWCMGSCQGPLASGGRGSHCDPQVKVIQDQME